MWKKGSTILFQGDSITDGARGRSEDLNHILGHGYAYLVASRFGADYPQQNFMFINRGISGNRIGDLYARMKEDVLNLNPDILSLLIGVNDVYFEQNNQSGANAAKFEKLLKLILEETKELHPDVRFVLCEPFIMRVGGVADNWEFWSEEIKKRQEIVRRTAALYGCVFVGLQRVFNQASEGMDAAYWIWDGIHPTAAGHELIARAWIKTVEISLKP